jgi:hypothetical protein
MVSDLLALEKRLEETLDARFKAQGEKIRRRLDLMVERVERHVRVALEVNARHGFRLDDCEGRVKLLEQGG